MAERTRSRLRFVPLLVASIISVPVLVDDARADDPVPVEGEWTQDEGRTTRSHHNGAETVVNVTINYVWASGTGIGTSFGNFDIRMNPDGTGTFAGFELFVGRMAGRSGTLVLWNEGTISNWVDYQGTAVSRTGTDELKNARLQGSYVGKVAQGGHWTDGTLTFG